jgi:hypothetical protein
MTSEQPVPGYLAITSELKIVVTACRCQLERRTVSEEAKGALRAAIYKIDLALELLQSAERVGD